MIVYLLQVAVGHFRVGSDSREDASARRCVHEEEWTSVLLAYTRHAARFQQQGGQLRDRLRHDGVIVPGARC